MGEEAYSPPAISWKFSIAFQSSERKTREKKQGNISQAALKLNRPSVFKHLGRQQVLLGTAHEFLLMVSPLLPKHTSLHKHILNVADAFHCVLK